MIDSCGTVHSSEDWSTSNERFQRRCLKKLLTQVARTDVRMHERWTTENDHLEHNALRCAKVHEANKLHFLYRASFGTMK